MNTYRAFSEAVKTTPRKQLIFGGLHTEICLTFALVQAPFRLPNTSSAIP